MWIVVKLYYSLFLKIEKSSSFYTYIYVSVYVYV